MYVKFKKGAKFTKKKGEDLAISDSLDYYDDAGYMLEDNEIVVDIDHVNKDVLEAMIKTFDIKTQYVWTDRGIHLYYKMPQGFKRAKSNTPLGFEVEYKYSPGTTAVTIKRDGKLREIHNEGVRENLPKFLMYGKYDLLLGLEEGDGRNQALYNHKRKINLLKDRNKILKFINEHIFTTPLDDKEFETVIRDDGNEIEKDDVYIIYEMFTKEVKCYKYNGNIYHYNGKRFVTNEDELNRLIAPYVKGRKPKFTEDIKKLIDQNCELINKSEAFKIKVRNGYLEDGHFYPYEFTGFTPYYIDIDYDPVAPPVDRVDEYLTNLSDGNEEYREFILEVLGHCLITDPEFKRAIAKFFIFVGDGGNGKGTLLQIISKILGNENCTSLSIKDLTDERYLNNIIGKLANLGDDIQDIPINNDQLKILKNLSTCDTITLRQLYKDALSYQSSASLIFTSNHILHSFEKDEGYKRRVIWCPIFTKPKKVEPDFISKITTPEALNYWFKLIVEAYRRLYERGQFEKVKILDEYNEDYHRENNNVVIYLESIKKEQLLNKSVKATYDDYIIWAEENCFNVLSIRSFSSSVMKTFELESKTKSINGKSVRIYAPKKENKKLRK